MTACGPKAACNVQPLLRVGTNLWKGRQCYYCTIFPAELQGETCSLDGALYAYDGDRRRLLAVNEKGEVISRPIDDLDLPDLPSPADETPISTPPHASPVLASTSIDISTTATAPAPILADDSSSAAVTDEEEDKTRAVSTPEPSSPVPTTAKPQIAPVRLSPEWTNKPKVSASVPAPPPVAATPAPSTPVTERVPLASVPATPLPATPAANSEPATPAESEIVTPVSSTPAAVSVVTSPSPSTLPEYQWLKDDLSLVNRKAKAAASIAPVAAAPAAKPAPVALAPAAVIVEAPKSPGPAPVPVPVAAAPKPAPIAVTAPAPAAETKKAAPVPVDPLAELAVSRRPLAALNALSTLLEKELKQLNEANAEVECLRALVRAKETERDVKAARVERYRAAIDDALTALEEERTSLMRMRATLAAALKL